LLGLSRSKVKSKNHALTVGRGADLPFGHRAGLGL
jgi:hypothetical protein